MSDSLLLSSNYESWQRWNAILYTSRLLKIIAGRRNCVKPKGVIDPTDLQREFTTRTSH